MSFKIHETKIGRQCQYLEFLPERMAFIKNGKKGETVYYKCKEKNCEASGKLSRGIFKRSLNSKGVIPEHNHSDHQLFLQVLDVKQDMKEKVQKSSDSYEVIYENSIKG